MTIQIREVGIATNNWAIDNDGQAIVDCPCCGAFFTKHGAEVIKRKLDEGTLNWEDLWLWDQMRRHATK